MDDGSKILMRIIITAVIFSPLLAPEVATVLGSMFWSAVYGLSVLRWFYFDAAKELPSFSPYEWNGILLWVGLLALSGLIRGIAGVVAMLVVWAPMFLLSPFYVWMGVGVQEGKKEWIQHNYVETGCETLFVCSYEPKQGRKLPSFVMDKVGDVGGKVVKITPWVPKNKV